MSQSVTVSLPPSPVIKRPPSGEKPTPQTCPRMPLSLTSSFGVAVSHSRTSFPQPPRAKNLLSRENDAATYQPRFRFVSRPLFSSRSEVIDLVSGLRIEVRYQFPSGDIAYVQRPGAGGQARVSCRVSRSHSCRE